jgi:hypothetical protein
MLKHANHNNTSKVPNQTRELILAAIKPSVLATCFEIAISTYLVSFLIVGGIHR